MNQDHNDSHIKARGTPTIVRHLIWAVPAGFAILVLLGGKSGCGDHHSEQSSNGPPPAAASASVPSGAQAQASSTTLIQTQAPASPPLVLNGCPEATHTWNHCVHNNQPSGPIVVSEAGMNVCFDQHTGPGQPSTRERWDKQTGSYVPWPDDENDNPPIEKFRFIGQLGTQATSVGYKLVKPGEACTPDGDT